MRSFESFLAKDLEAFIAYRISLGYSEIHMRTYLRHLDRYVGKHQSQWEDFTGVYFIRFKKSLDYAPKTVNAVISLIRLFFAYLQRIDFVKENPLQDIPDEPLRPYIPFLFSEEDTDRLLVAAYRQIRKNPAYFFRDYKLYTILLLIARCGLRISEPVRLKIGDYRPEDCTIYIRKTKFKKSRLIPVPLSVTGEINNYLNVRKHEDIVGEYLFPGKKSGKMGVHAIRMFFDQAVKAIGCDQKKTVINQTCFGKPIPHSLRHSFAVNTLKRIRERGDSPQHALPVLATYMGHSHYKHTAVYLKALDAQDRNALFDITQRHWGKT